MFNYHRVRALLNLKTLTISEPFASRAPKWYPFPQHHPSPISLTFFSTTSDQQSFTVSYLTTNCGFSPEAALKACKRVRFDTPEKPDSVLAFFRNHGFSNSHTLSIIARAPELLTCNPHKRILPKFEFLASKGASHSDIVLIVTKNPHLMRTSLQNHIVPVFELVRRFCPSDEKAIACVIACPSSISDPRVEQNVKLLLDEGVTHSNIHHLLRTRPSILCSNDLRKTLEEVKELGFDPFKFIFSVALLAKRTVTKSQWDAKVDTFKSWGWSEEEICDAFRRHPQIMLRSKDKLNAVMGFWVNQFDRDPSALVGAPVLFGFSLEKRLIPRALVIQHLLSKGLIKKNASIVSPFSLSEKLFLHRFVRRFEKETSLLLKLYQGECEHLAVG